jgi:hypothetical protein
LAYLAIQIRQNTAQLRRAEQHSRVSALDETVRSFNVWREQIATHRDTAELWTRGLADPRELDEVDTVRFELLLRTYFYTMQATYRRSQSAAATETWENSRVSLAKMLSNPGAAAYWSASQGGFDRDFFAEVADLRQRESRR